MTIIDELRARCAATENTLDGVAAFLAGLGEQLQALSNRGDVDAVLQLAGELQQSAREIAAALTGGVSLATEPEADLGSEWRSSTVGEAEIPSRRHDGR